jgi:hypothetical protein
MWPILVKISRLWHQPDFHKKLVLIISILFLGLTLALPGQVAWAGVSHQTVPTAKPTAKPTKIPPSSTKSSPRPDQPTATLAPKQASTTIIPTNIPTNSETSTVPPENTPVATKRVFPTKPNKTNNPIASETAIFTQTPQVEIQSTDTQERPIAASLTAVFVNVSQSNAAGTNLTPMGIGFPLVALGLVVGLVFILMKKH